MQPLWYRFVVQQTDESLNWTLDNIQILVDLEISKDGEAAWDNGLSFYGYGFVSKC